MNIFEKDGKLTIIPEGRLDTVTAPELMEAVRDAEFTELTLNLERLEFISSAGLRALLVCRQSADAQGAELTVENPCTAVFEVMKVSGFARLLNVSGG